MAWDDAPAPEEDGKSGDLITWDEYEEEIEEPEVAELEDAEEARDVLPAGTPVRARQPFMIGATPALAHRVRRLPLPVRSLTVA